MALSTEEERMLKHLLRKAAEDNPRRYVPETCLLEYHALCAQSFTELVFWRQNKGDDPEFLLKFRDDQWWKKLWHIPGTKHDPGRLMGNPLQITQALAEREFPGIKVLTASVVDGFQWKMGADHPWCNPTSLVTLCTAEDGVFVETETQRFFTLAAASELNMVQHHLDFLRACDHVVLANTPYVHRLES